MAEQVGSEKERYAFNPSHEERPPVAGWRIFPFTQPEQGLDTKAKLEPRGAQVVDAGEWWRSSERISERLRFAIRIAIAAQRSSEAGWRWRDHGYTFTPRSGPHMNTPTFLINNHRVDTLSDAEKKAVEEAAVESATLQQELWAKRSEESKKKFVFTFGIHKIDTRYVSSFELCERGSFLFAILLRGLIHQWRSGWRVVSFRWRSSLGGILVLVVVGLGLVVAALAVADAAQAQSARFAYL